MITILVGEEPVELTWEQWEHRVNQGQIASSTMVRFPPVTEDAFKEAAQLEIYTSLVSHSAAAWNEAFRKAPPPVMTALLVGVQIRIWWLAWSSSSFNDIAWTFLSAPAIFEDGEVWRLISMGFIHMDIGHLLSNLAVMMFVGWNLERALGHWNIALIFIASVVGGSLFSIWMTPEAPSIGASGGVFGLVAASAVFGFFKNEILPPKARRVFGWAIFPYLVFMFGTGWLDANVDNWAHFGGLLSGALLAVLVEPISSPIRSWRTFTPLAIAAGVSFSAVTLWFAGPSIMPIQDTRPTQPFIGDTPSTPVEQKYRSLIWHAPVGWERLQGPNGMSLFVSKESEERAWGVRTRKSRKPQDIPSLLKEWDERFSALEMSPISDEPQLINTRHPSPMFEKEYKTSTLSNSHLRLRIAVKGIYIFEEVWKVSANEKTRLQPLLTRLEQETVWGPSASYLDAKRDYERRPKNRKVMAKFGMALLEWGQVEEATQLFNQIAKEHPSRNEGWTGLLKAAQWYPESKDMLHHLADTIFENNPDPKLLTALAVTFNDVGQKKRANALLDASWERLPGDRSLRRQRRNQGLSTALHNGVPSYLFWDRTTGAPIAAGPLPQGPISRNELEERIREMERQSSAITEHLEMDLTTQPARTTSSLIFLATGTIPTSDALLPEVEKLVEGIRLVQLDSPPPWMSPSLVTAIQTTLVNHPSWTQNIVDLAAALLVQKKPSALGTTVAMGSGPQALLRKEQIEFLSQRTRSLLLADLGFEESKNKAYLSDIRIQRR